ncbi:putative membrane protein [Acinetobacter sp. 694762]|nr:putative membrane protein [Acinetobacter sp. 694762]
MYKKDKQGMIVVLIALTLFLAISIGFKFQSAVVAEPVNYFV